ncbi:MAG: tRNA (N(6)-L-threonylcarbamoyladenosine(37)-C(2))-methylthiotransferase MtaB [Thermoleophilia bacterium]
MTPPGHDLRHPILVRPAATRATLPRTDSAATALPPAAAPTVAFRTLGCKLNQCETAQMEEVLTAHGYRTVPWESPAVVRVLNTCTVTGKTDRACRHEIRRAKRRDPGARLVVTGCYAQVAPEKVAAIPGVELVLGNIDKLNVARHIDDLLARTAGAEPAGRSAAPRPVTLVTPFASAAAFQGDFITHFSGYTRAFLKVQNGCDSHCSYCVIPAARGPSRSMARAQVLAQVRLLAERGYREIVITGIHLGAWGRDTGEGTLADLLHALAKEGAAARYRLSSTEPREIDNRVLAVMRAAGPRFADHFHVPLQSGADTVLRRMNRPYDAAGYAERVQAIRAAFPEAAIGADVIVGFPGETEEEFEQTRRLVADLPLTYLHVFSYSDRPGTRASTLPGKVPPEIAQARSESLRALGAEKNAAFQERFAGRELTALLLHQTADDGRRVGLTGNYIEVLVEAAHPANEFVVVRLLRRLSDGRWDARVTRVLGDRAG